MQLLKPTQDLILVLVFLVCSSAFVFGQTNAKPQKSPTKNKPDPGQRSVEIELLLNNARSLPAEFAIDSMIEIASSTRVVDPEWKKEILEEAFKLITDVQNPARRKVAAFRGVPVDTRPGYHTYAFDLALDALSLRGKIITAMLSLDKPRALQLLNSISPKLDLKPLSCTDNMTYDVAGFYGRLGAIAQSAFDGRQIAEGERLQFLRPYVEGMVSHSQVEPIAELLIALKLQPLELFELSRSFDQSLKDLAADDRSFTNAVWRGTLTSSLLKLIDSNRILDTKYSGGLESLRSYLLTNLKQTRCQENVNSSKQLYPILMNGIIFDSATNLAEIKPSKIEPPAVVVSYYQSEDSKKLMSEFKSLRFRQEERLTDAERATPEWQQRMLDYLGHLQSWEGKTENSAIDHFHQKCIFYRSLIDLAPSGQPREQVLRSFIKVLNNPTIQKENRIEWMFHASGLIAICKKAKADERNKLLDLMFYSQQPVLQVYASLIKEGILKANSN